MRFDSSTPEKRPHVRIVGVGGAGIAALNHLADEKLAGIDLLAIDTASEVLSRSLVKTALLIGGEVTHGLGAGGSPERGREAAEASKDDLYAALAGAARVFVIGGLGGGTGTGATPVIAHVARELHAEITAVMSQPFTFEGSYRQQIARAGLPALSPHVDKLVTVRDNDLIPLLPPNPDLDKAFLLAARMLIWQALAQLV